MQDPGRIATYIRERVIPAVVPPTHPRQVLEIGTHFFPPEGEDDTVFAPTTVEQHDYAMNWMKANIQHEGATGPLHTPYRIPSPWRDSNKNLQCFMVALVLTEALADVLVPCGCDEHVSLSEEGVPSTLSSIVYANCMARIGHPEVVEATMESARATLIRLAPEAAFAALPGEFEGDVTLSPEWVARAVMPFI